MTSQQGRVPISISSLHGDWLATLCIVERTPASLFKISEYEAASRGEECVQLLEGRSYEYELDVAPTYAVRLRETAAIQPSRLSDRLGRIEPGLSTGLLPIILESESGDEVGHTAVEVRTNKLDYHRDYRFMLEYIAEKSIGLLLDINAPSQARLAPNSNIDTPSLHQRFAFLNQLLLSRDFRDAISAITAMPHHRTASEIRSVETNRGVRPSRAFVSSLARGSQRIPLPAAHPAYRAMAESGVSHPTLPRHATTRHTYETRDTPENRFVKFALTEFLSTILDIENVLAERQTPVEFGLRRDVARQKRMLSEHLESELFREVGPASALPFGSPVLQRRHGYREVLTTWLKFTLAAKLAWSGGADVFGAGKKDVALLYEYWVFFILIEVISSLLDFDQPAIASLVGWSGSGFDLKLKTGTVFSITSTYGATGHSLNVRFSYNRTFTGVSPSHHGSYPRPGSWTRSMRPDYSLSIWPQDLSEIQAELNGRIVHIHFDAKYRVDSLVGLFGTGSEGDLVDDDLAQRSNTRPKRSDLLKMHSYRDAIRRTEGAYVLYPGSPSGNVSWIEYHEIIPGLGAFSVRPGQEKQAKAALTQFIMDVLDHLSEVDSILAAHS
jgi:predicted component of viral defense system (DUF524 family)